MVILIAIENEIMRTGVKQILLSAFPDYRFVNFDSSILHQNETFHGVITSYQLFGELKKFKALDNLPWMIILPKGLKVEVDLFPGNPRALLDVDCAYDEIQFAWKCLLRNRPFVCGSLLSNASTEDIDLVDLSDRERQILFCIAEGLKTHEIADRLFLSHHTINSHRKSLLKKFEVKSPVELVVKAIRLSFIQP